MQIIPPPGVIRALTVRSVVYAIGSGVFQAGSAVFFTQLLGLSATQIGIGLSVAGAVAIACSVPVGVLIDKIGARRTWIIAGFAEAAFFLVYPMAGSFAMFVLIASLIAIAAMTASTARAVYTMAVVPADERVRAMAYQRSALNVGFMVGAALAGIAFVVGTPTAYTSLVLANAAGLLVTTLFVLRMPLVARVKREKHVGKWGALGDRPFLVVSAVNGVLTAHSSLFLIVLPLWILTRTDAPMAMYPVLFIINSVLCVLLQLRASRGTETAVGAGRALMRSGWLIALSCVIVAAAALTSGWATIAVLGAGSVVLLLGELVQSAGAWGITATLPPPSRRGEYVGVFNLGTQGQQMLAPAGLTLLAAGTEGWGWLVIAALMLVAGSAAPRVVAWALRTPRLGATKPAPVNRDLMIV